MPQLLQAITDIGYRGYPYDPRRREALARRQGRALLSRMAIAVLAMMQVMMFAFPVYVSRDGVEPEYRTLLAWASLVLTLPVVLYSATPFFHGAWRDLRSGRLGMDTPIALGIATAFVASAWATLVGQGAVYFDSVTMFVALLLVARWFELRARQRAGDDIEAVARELPPTAERLRAYPEAAEVETVAAAHLVAGDVVRIATAAVVPADGEVLAGRSSVEEALLTGESWPQAKACGDKVLAGSINRESPLIVRVTAAGAATALAALSRLVDRAASQRPRIGRLADSVAGWFVGVLLVVAVGTALFWWQVDASRAVMITFAVLVVSCPCALSLATPSVLAAAAGALGRRQILVVRADAIEALSRVTHVVLDKTGTLTTGRVELVAVATLGAQDAAQCLSLAAALEQGSVHPVATALRAAGSPTQVATERCRGDRLWRGGNHCRSAVPLRTPRLGHADPRRSLAARGRTHRGRAHCGGAGGRPWLARVDDARRYLAAERARTGGWVARTRDKGLPGIGGPNCDGSTRRGNGRHRRLAR